MRCKAFKKVKKKMKEKKIKKPLYIFRATWYHDFVLRQNEGVLIYLRTPFSLLLHNHIFRV